MIHGIVEVPGDKSISHRALIIASQAYGTSEITGLLEGEDVLATAHALQQLGVNIKRCSTGVWQVEGMGGRAFQEPKDIINCGNSGTGARLLMGLVVPAHVNCFMTGDESLRKRPMLRVIEPLQLMGGRFVYRKGGKFPLVITAAGKTCSINYTLPVPSAQVKSAILLAGLNIAGTTTVKENRATRDHTELMLQSFGAKIQVSKKQNITEITVVGKSPLEAHPMNIPGDPSSAAFLAVAALIVSSPSHAELIIKNVCCNPLRIGLFITLQEMGADITLSNKRQQCGEVIADLVIRPSQLKGVVVPAERAPSMIDEYPILAIAAACAEGETIMKGLAELKVKESNRLQAIAEGLKKCGVEVEVSDDSLMVKGRGKGVIEGGAMVKTYHDHRIAMAFLVMGLVTKKAVTVDHGQMIATSFPSFISVMKTIGATIVQKK